MGTTLPNGLKPRTTAGHVVPRSDQDDDAKTLGKKRGAAAANRSTDLMRGDGVARFDIATILAVAEHWQYW